MTVIFLVSQNYTHLNWSPPLVVELELEPDDDDEPESLPEWETSDKLSGSASSSTITHPLAPDQWVPRLVVFYVW